MQPTSDHKIYVLNKRSDSNRMQLGKKFRMSELITNFFNFQNNSMVSVASEKAA